MSNNKFNDYFLGASSPEGFFSLFRKSFDHHEWTACIIKGGPGTGKSSLMKRIAEAAALNDEKCQRAFCSSDPESLDAVILPDRKFVIMDGTAPHIVNPSYPGVCEFILDLGECWDKSKLMPHRERIIELTDGCSACHRQAQRCLSAASAFRQASYSVTDPLIDIDKIHRAADRQRENLPRHGLGGFIEERLLSAVTKDGVVVFEDTIHNQCDVCIPVDDRFSRCSALFLGRLKDILSKCGFGLVVCYCSQMPESIEHILIPEASVAYSSANRIHCVDAGRTIHSSRFMKRALSSEERKVLTENEKNEKLMLSQASKHMTEAKLLHDELESFYINAMDFDSVRKKGDALIMNLFG